MKVYISAPRHKRFFVEYTKEVAGERLHEAVYPPDDFRDLNDKQILDKVMRELRTSHIVLMDVSMKNFGEEWYPNSGVMIEFGLVMRDPTKGLKSVYFFCDEATERNHLPPMIPRVEVEQYSENVEDFSRIIIAALEAFEREAPEKLRQALEAQAATEILYETKKTTST